jgi:hypothetical protein
MMEPERLIETTEDPSELALLQAGRRACVTPELRANVLAQLGLAPATGTAQVVQLRSRTRRIALAAIVVSTLAAAMPIAYFSLSSEPKLPTAIEARETETEATVDQGRHLRAEESRTPDVTLPVPTVTVPSSEGAESTKREAVESRRVANTGATATSKSAASDYLAAELAALDAVRQKMQAGDAKSALSALDAYQRDFSKPHLSLEAEVLRIFALDQSGQKDVARRRAQNFIAKYPKGVLSARVRRYLGQ